MKDENYIIILGWMINQLGLAGTELLVYAIIYGFSQDGQSKYDGSLKYLQESTSKGRSAIIEALSSLVQKGYLVKIVELKNGVSFPCYKTVPPVRKSDYPRPEIGLPPSGNRTTPRPEIGPNKILDNTNDIKSNITEIEKREIFETWIKYKSEIKKPYKSIISLAALLKKFNEESLEKCKSVVANSIQNNYQGLFWDSYKAPVTNQTKTFQTNR